MLILEKGLTILDITLKYIQNKFYHLAMRSLVLIFIMYYTITKNDLP